MGTWDMDVYTGTDYDGTDLDTIKTLGTYF